MTTSTPHLDSESPLAAMAAIWDRTREASLARVTVLEETVAALIENRLSDEQRRTAEREAHRLAGSSGTFGFHRASEAARQLEWVFAGDGAVPPDRMLLAAEEVVTLRADLDRDPSPATTETPRPSLPTDQSPGRREVARGVVVAVGDARTRQGISAAAEARGFRVTQVDDPEQLPAEGEAPVAALVDLGLPRGAGVRLISRLTAGQSGALAVALTPTEGFCDRVEALRAGASSYLGLGSPPEETLDAMEELLLRTRTTGSTVLVVDDDEAVLGAVDTVLSPAGVRTVGLEEPARFWTVLEEERPDLVILDLDMPEVRGDDLCRLVRSDPRWASLPILFLTAHGDADAVAAVFSAGADDFVAKPFGGPELVARVKNRLERSRLLQTLAETDPLTGLANRRQSEVDLHRLLGLAERHHQPFSIAMIDLDRFKQVNDAHGHALGDTVLRRVGSLLRRSFRGEDVVARWGGEEFLVGMYGMTRHDAVQHIASVLETLREERFATPSGRSLSVTFSAGVATLPEDGTTVHAICDAADQALYRAKRHGGDRVLALGSADSELDVDVVVVEDDEALADLLGHALTTRGYSFRHISDGRVAAEQLAGDSPPLNARVVLLDVDLPVINGFAVLRQLATTGRLGATKVIMLTARSTETEVVESLELGAFDHVAKPFSVPVLLQRIRRALAS